VNYSTKEMFEHIEARLADLSLQLANQGQLANSEIRDVRHRVANVEATTKLYDLKLGNADKELHEVRAEITAFKTETRSAMHELTDALKPMNDFLAGQAGVDKWKRSFYAAVSLLIAILGLVGGWAWASP
jgi:chromosome segregation ATPase